MNFKFVRKGIIIATLAGILIIPVQKIAAAEITEIMTITKQDTTDKLDKNYLVNAAAEIQKQQNKENTIQILSSEEIKFNNRLLDKVFVKSEEGFSYVYAEPQEDSDWTGKVFEDSTVKIAETGDTWSAIESGNVKGYVKTESLLIGNEAIEQAKTILTETYPDINIYTLTDEELEGVFSLGETKEEEMIRIAAEEKARAEADAAARRQKRNDIVDYAKRFIGNPYVYGGTSLTRGTDCSGFVKGVYKHFGVELPRTSYAMRRVGQKVRVSEMQPGDIVCYSGHVGIYAGNGKIVNAIDEQRGIGMSNVNYKSIITVRRIF